MPYKNKEDRIRNNKKYYQKNKEQIKKRVYKNRENNIDKFRERDRKYYEKNKDYINRKNKEYRKNNIDKFRERSRKYYRKNKDRENEKRKIRWREYYKCPKNRKKELLRRKKYRMENIEKAKMQEKKSRIKCKEKIKERHKIWYQKNKIEINKKKVDARNSDISKKFRHNMSALIREKFKRKLLNKNGKSTFIFISYTIDDLIKHLESLFQQGMSWKNYGMFGWHIDHIIPDCSFNYKSVEDPEFQKCWALENLQPLWAKDNWSKNRF